MESKGDYVRRKTMERLKDNPDLCLMDFQDGILAGIEYNKENKMRSIKELLEVMLDHKDHFYEGLCSWNYNLYCIKVITNDEFKILRKYIRENRPKWYSSFSAFWTITSAYYWEYDNIEPRIRWIKRHIKLNK